jgi:hypothetical protein
MSAAIWRKSSYSSNSNDACVEVATNLPGTVVPVRDSKAPDGPALTFPASAWTSFVHMLGAGELP